jgi:hypothetical protein
MTCNHCADFGTINCVGCELHSNRGNECQCGIVHRADRSCVEGKQNVTGAVTKETSKCSKKR